MPKYFEKEITQPIKLCDAEGNLNRESVGWSRKPMHICNLSGHYPRKKRWNFWMVLCEELAFSVTLANIDYIGAGNAFLFDLKKQESITDNTLVLPQGRGLDMPETVDTSVGVAKKNFKAAIEHVDGGIRIRVNCPDAQNGPLKADIMLDKPADHETLNTVIPWNDEEFHFTSKQNTLPASGTVTVGDAEYVFDPSRSYGTLDFGRGIWPKEFIWNWSSFSHRQGDDLIGINLGAKWTDGTGSNENGVCLNGKLYKISEDVIFGYDTSDWMKPWTLRTEVTDMLDLKLTPVYDKSSGVNMGDTKTGTHQCFGHFTGTIKAGGRTLRIDNAYGWAEEHTGNW